MMYSCISITILVSLEIFFFFFVRLSETGYLQVKLQSGNIDYSSNVRLQVYTDPSCTYQLKILVSPVQMLGQVGGGLDLKVH